MPNRATHDVSHRSMISSLARVAIEEFRFKAAYRTSAATERRVISSICSSACPTSKSKPVTTVQPALSAAIARAWSAKDRR